MTQREADRLAKTGADFLDDNDPSWPQLIDLETLDIGRGQVCIVAQLGDRCPKILPLLSVELGMMPALPTWKSDARKLTHSWKRLIKQRLRRINQYGLEIKGES